MFHQKVIRKNILLRFLFPVTHHLNSRPWSANKSSSTISHFTKHLYKFYQINSLLGQFEVISFKMLSISRFGVLIVLFTSTILSAPVPVRIEDVPSSSSLYKQKDSNKFQAYTYTNSKEMRILSPNDQLLIMCLASPIICRSNGMVNCKVNLFEQKIPTQPMAHDSNRTTIEKKDLSSIWRAITRWVRFGGKFSGSVSPFRIPPPNIVRIGNSESLDAAIDYVASSTRGGS